MSAIDYAELRLRKTDGLRGAVERRMFAADLELRATDDGNVVHVTGYAAVTGVPYPIGDPDRGGFTETIVRGAFARTLSETPDVVLNALHGRGLSGLPLARTKSGTLTLAEDDRGLRFAADLDPTDPDVQILVPKLRRGDLDGASFAFRVTAESWSEDRSKRTVQGVTLHQGDVSIVDFGANPAASTQLARDLDVAPGRQLVAVTAERRARERLAVLQAGGRPRMSVESGPSRAIDEYRARLAALRGRS